MSAIRKRSKRNSTHGMQMRNVESELAATFRHRKEKNVQLHDEADLVNFRADNIRRFAQNQELLQNVVSKLIHTSRIKPPRVFPEASESYSGKSDEELEKIVQSANSSDLLIFSNIRLMRAKSKLLEAEILAQKNSNPGEDVLSAESAFQKEACETLARLQSEHRFGESNSDNLKRMEEALASIQKQCAEEYKTTLRSSHKKYTRKSMAATELDPNVVISKAPAGYSARESRGEFGLPLEKGAMDHMGARMNDTMEPFQENMSKGYGSRDELEGKEPGMYRSGENDGPSQELGSQNQGFGSQNRDLGSQNRDLESQNQEFGSQNQEFEPQNQDFEPQNQEFEPQNQDFEPQNQEYGEFDEMIKPTEKNSNRDEGLNNLGVNMDDLDQFLADPNHGNNEMDDMDALMNFDQDMDGDHGANNADSIDESFGVDFLSHMD